jgi:thiol-disulfide isomerase/thioredoxin
MLKKTRRMAVILPLLIVSVLGCSLSDFFAQPGFLSIGTAAPDFTLQTFDGDSLTLSQQRGKVVLINFWASWCGPCRTEAPDLNAIWGEYRGAIL